MVLYLETSGAEAQLAAQCVEQGYDRVFRHEFSDNFYEMREGETPLLWMSRSMNLLCVSTEALAHPVRAPLRAVLVAQQTRGAIHERLH